jgi:hypothetical protein
VKTSLSAWSSQRNSSWRNYTYLTEVTLTTGTLVEAEHWLAQAWPPMLICTGSRWIRSSDSCLHATRLATVQQQYLRAAMLFGVAEATRSATQTMLAQPMRALADAALATVHAALEPAAFAEAFAAGQAMRFEEAQTILFMTDRLKA